MGRADLATETERTRRRGRAQLPTECPFPRLCLLVAIPGLFPAVDARPIRPISAPDQSHPSLSPATARPPRPRLSPTLDLPLSPVAAGSGWGTDQHRRRPCAVGDAAPRPRRAQDAVCCLSSEYSALWSRPRVAIQTREAEPTTRLARSAPVWYSFSQPPVRLLAVFCSKPRLRYRTPPSELSLTRQSLHQLASDFYDSPSFSSHHFG